MTDSPRLSRITIYPIKSLDGMSVSSVDVLPSGALRDDRRYAIVDREGQCVNAKRCDRLHRLRATFDLESQIVTLTPVAEPVAAAAFSLFEQRRELARWLSERLAIPCRVIENTERGFPDDRDANGPTLISAATLDAVASWFPGLSASSVRRRFRANLELDAAQPFWEDGLLGETAEGGAFRIGEVRFLAVNPCQRCPVPTRSPDTGEAWPGFAQQFCAMREKTLPAEVNRERFDHYYRLAVNTRLAPPAAGGRVALGDVAEAIDDQA